MKNILILLIINLIASFSFGQTENDGFYFDGVDDYINVGGAAGTNISNINSTTTNNRTYETWFKAEEVTTRQFIMKEGAGTRAVLVYIEGGYLIVGAYNRADYTPQWQGTFFRKAITAGTWYHVAMVLDNALAANTSTNLMGADKNTALKFYLNGNLIGENSGYEFGGHNTMRLGYKDASVRLPGASETWVSQTNPLDSEYFYSSSALTNYSGTNYFEGYLWGFRLWNRVRTQQEIDDYKADIITTVGTDDLVAILDGDTFEYLNNDDTTTSEATVSPITTIIWSATAATTDWNTGSNWDGGSVPDVLTKEAVEIQASTNYPIITSGTHIIAGDLQVNVSASITIQSGGTLEVSYDIINNGTIDVKESGSLVLREKKDLGGTGDYNVERLTPTYGGNDFYSYWSSPVNSSGDKIGTVFPDAELIYFFNAISAGSDWEFQDPTSDFETGVGYAIQNEGTGGQLRTFSGVVNSGDITVNIYNTSNLAGEGSDGNEWSEGGDNLVGNPYPAAIDWDLVITDPDNTEINGEIYLWKQLNSEVGENNVNEYLVYNLTGTNEATPITSSYIGTGQGFFIKTESLESDLKITFKTTHQVPGENTQFYRSSNTNSNTQKTQGRSWFTFNHNDKTNTLLIGFLEGATNEYDRLYDAPFDTNQKSMGFYTLVNGVSKAAIQGLPELKEDEVIVELGYVVDEMGDYSIDIKEEYIDEDYYIYLLDTEKEITIDLRQKSYDFTIETIGENSTRFKIIYSKEEKNTSQKSLGTDLYSVDDSKNLTVFVNDGKELMVAYDLETVKKVTLFNIQGREVAVFIGEQTKDVSNLSAGVYIVAATLEDNRIFNKKIMITK